MKSLLPGKKKFVTFLGRPEYRKGLEFLVDAWKEVVARVPDAGLMIVSLMTKEEYEKWLNELKQAKLANHVYILNKWLSDEEKASLFCASDAIALPSIYEPFGIVALEALAADYACERLGLVGPVVIVGNTGGMGEIIRSGVNGLEVPISEFKMDTNLLAKMLVDALTNEALRRRLATHGAKRVQSKYFNWDFIFSCVLETWKKSVDNYKVYKRFKI
jgi:glycosyltransferase involved in cell wall biosynthesis